MLEPLKSSNTFEHSMPDAIIIWGAGSFGWRTFNWLQRQNMEHKIICFIDINTKRHGSLFCGKKILPPDCLKEHTTASVIGSIIPWHEIYEAMLDNGFHNPFFVAIHNMSLKRGNDVRQTYGIDKINSVYASGDIYTKSMIKLNSIILRENIDTVIVPIESMLQDMSLSLTGTKPTGYWEAEETRLDCFGSYTLIDGGAYIGDSLQSITRYTKSRLAHAYCFEPDKEYVKKLRQYINEKGLNDTVSVFEAVLGERKTAAAISNPETTGAGIAEPADGITETTSIDSMDIIVAGKLCIKLDIEGAELAALRGASATIRKHKPELAICVYHKDNDIYEIPDYIKSIVPEYNCILRGSWHMVCLASVERYGAEPSSDD
jgi:FkbM family methyltransferase